MKVTVYASKAEEVKKRLDKIAKKAERYSVPFSYTMGEEHPQKIEVREVDPADYHTIYTVATYTVAAVDFEIDCDQFVKQDGWTLCAKIEHGDEGNIVDSFNYCDIPSAWYSIPAHCDHCKTNRARSVTYMVKNESGEVKQVGASCLHDYTGINPGTAALWASVVEAVRGDLDCTREEWESENRGGIRMYDVRDILALASANIAARGYHRSEDTNSTRDAVLAMLKDGTEPEAKWYDKADKIIAWAKERSVIDRAQMEELNALYREAVGHTDDWTQEWVEDNEKLKAYHKRNRELYGGWNAIGDLERNCFPAIRSGYAKVQHTGRLAYLPVAYDKYLDKKAEAERKAAQDAASQHIGKVGERISFEVSFATTVTSWATEWGTTFLEKIVDNDGNIFMWKTSTGVEIKPGYKVTGTVKEHSEYNGTKQTVLTRCKVEREKRGA